MNYFILFLVLSTSVFAQKNPEVDKIFKEVDDATNSYEAKFGPIKKPINSQSDVFKELDRIMMDERMLQCQMSADENEIVCPDKVYTLSKKSNNTQRINTKLDLKKEEKSIKATGVNVLPE